MKFAADLVARAALPAAPPPTAPESKVPRRAQLCASHWVQGSPLPPAAQAIISLRYFHRHFLDRGLGFSREGQPILSQ